MGIVSSQEMETYLKQNFDLEINQDLVTYREYINKLLLLEKIIFSIDKYNVQKAIESTMKLFIKSFPFSWHFIMCRLIFASFISQNKDTFLIFNYLMLIEKEEEMFDQSTDRILHVFTQFVLSSNTRESDYILQKMNEQNLIDQTIIKRKKSLYFAQHLSDKTINKIKHNGNNYIYQDLIQEVKKDDWELHKKHIKEGHNPNEIAKIIRNDEIEKLQEISTQNDFNFNQRIAPSLYERCSFINQRNITLIDYAAFFSAVKCFKYLLMNGANIDNTGKYAIAGGNLEIIHLCEQNHALMEDSYETAIEFHRNDIFYYLYENKIKEVKNLTYLVINCIKYDNYEIFSFLENEGIEVDIFIINEAARNGNIFFVNYFLAGKTYPKNLFFLSLESGNIEFIRYLLEKKGLNVNEKNYYLFYIMLFQVICWNINI